MHDWAPMPGGGGLLGCLGHAVRAEGAAALAAAVPLDRAGRQCAGGATCRTRARERAAIPRTHAALSECTHPLGVLGARVCIDEGC